MYYRLKTHFYSVGLQAHFMRKQDIYVINRKDLYAYIGHMYLTSVYPIERIKYELIKPEDANEIFNASEFLVKFE